MNRLAEEEQYHAGISADQFSSTPCLIKCRVASSGHYLGIACNVCPSRIGCNGELYCKTSLPNWRQILPSWPLTEHVSATSYSVAALKH